MSQSFGEMLKNEDFYNILEELIDFGISRYKENFSMRYQDTDLVLYQKYTYEDACRLLNWERNEVPLNIGGYKYDKKQKHFLYLSTMISRMILVILQNTKIILQATID